MNTKLALRRIIFATALACGSVRGRLRQSSSTVRPMAPVTKTLKNGDVVTTTRAGVPGDRTVDRRRCVPAA